MDATKPREFDSSTEDLPPLTNAPGFAEPTPVDTSAEMYTEVLTPDRKPAPPEGPKRAGYTTNKGRKRNKARARMAKTSRVRNRR